MIQYKILKRKTKVEMIERKVGAMKPAGLQLASQLGIKSKATSQAASQVSIQPKTL